MAAIALAATQDSETAQAERPRLEHSYVELVAPDATLAPMNEAERAYIMELAQNGDMAALQVIFRSMLADPERGARLLDLPRFVRQELIVATCGAQNELTRKSFLVKADMVEADMLREASGSPLERLLIERVTTCWLAAEMADMDAARQEEEHMPNFRGNYADYYARRQDRAHKRFLQSVDALVRMRRLASPMPLMAGQVNIAAPGGQQVNIAQPAMPTAPAIDGAIPTIPTP